MCLLFVKKHYQKYSIKNTTDQDMYINPEAFAKGKKAGDVLMDEEQKTEYYMQKFSHELHCKKNTPEKVLTTSISDV